jgi:lactate dehydrogenase-like 2-hydroxyacid dehydrogenase
LEARLRSAFEVVGEPSDGVVAAVTTSRFGLDAARLDALPSLGAIVHFGVGYETTDVAYARARGVVVGNTPDVLTDCVADLAVGGLIDVMRRLSAADRFVRRGDWVRGQFPLAVRVTGRRVGVLGLGRIGRAVAHRLEGFDARLGYHSRRRVPGVPYRFFESPVALAAASEVLVVATSGGGGSAGLVSAEVLAALGPAGFLVNVARGSVVDEAALVAALSTGGIAGAALDVFADEPRVPESLCALDNVVLLPHIGSATVETRAAMADLVFANLARFMADGTLVTPVP